MRSLEHEEVNIAPVTTVAGVSPIARRYMAYDDAFWILSGCRMLELDVATGRDKIDKTMSLQGTSASLEPGTVLAGCRRDALGLLTPHGLFKMLLHTPRT